MLRNGIPEEVTAALRSVSRSFRGWGSHVAVTRTLEDGEAMSFGIAPWRFCIARVIALPTPSSGTSSARS